MAQGWLNREDVTEHGPTRRPASPKDNDGPLWLQRAAGNVATALVLQRGRGVVVAQHESGARAGVRGHVMERHVGKSRDWLKKRATDDRLALATTFTDEAAADRAVTFCLEHNAKGLRDFAQLTGSPTRKVFSAPTKSSVGFGVRPDGTVVARISGVKVVVTRPEQGKWQILTAYPTVDV